MEDKWFEESNWEGELTDTILIKAVNSDVAKKIEKAVNSYLISLGFRHQNEEDVKKRKINDTRNYFCYWKVDLVKRTFHQYDFYLAGIALRIAKAEKIRIPLAKPSQIQLYIQDKKGFLTGKKFGI